MENIKKFKESCLDSFQKITSVEVHFEEIQFEELLLKTELIEEQKVIEPPKVNQRRAGPKPIIDSNFCIFCNTFIHRAFSTHAYDIHLKYEDANHVRCQICQKKIPRRSSLLHFQRHNNRFESPKTCNVCNKSFIEVFAYEKHITSYHQKFCCEHCEYVARDKNRMKIHILGVHFLYKKCRYCGKQFHDVAAFESHVQKEKKKRENEWFYCDICGFKAHEKVILVTHKISKHEVANLTCETCGKTGFKSKYTLQWHQRTYHRDATFMCDLCGKKFHLKSVMKKHFQRMHLRVTETCHICQKSMSKGRLTGHLKTVHSNVRNFSCSKCNLAFKTKQMLRKHSYSHEGKRPFNCHLCATGYYMKQYLMSHYERSHSLQYTLEELSKVCRYENSNI